MQKKNIRSIYERSLLLNKVKAEKNRPSPEHFLKMKYLVVNNAFSLYTTPLLFTGRKLRTDRSLRIALFSRLTATDSQSLAFNRVSISNSAMAITKTQPSSNSFCFIICRFLIFDGVIPDMRKIITLIAITALAVNSFAQIIKTDEPKSFMPDGTGDVKIGMGISDFQMIKDTTKMERDVNFAYSYIAFTETFTNNAVKTIYYKFDAPQNGKNIQRPLYELRFEFNEVAAADIYADSKFGGMYRSTDFAEKEWFLATDKDYWLLIRKTQNVITIAAMMNGTEWGFE